MDDVAEESESGEESDDEEDAHAPAQPFQWEGFSLSGSAHPHSYEDLDEEASDDESDSDESDSEDEGHDQKRRKTSKQKAKERERKEREIRAKEREIAMGDESTVGVDTWGEDDFERELMACPNDSKLWIRYMAFRLSLADVEAARKVRERSHCSDWRCS